MMTRLQAGQLEKKCDVIYYIAVLGPLGRRERSQLRAAKLHTGISSQHFARRALLESN
jgi:hypothetical protein